MSDTGELLLKILVIDDDERYVDSLYRDGQRYGMVLRHAASLEEGRELFEGGEGRGFAGVILDVECLKRRSDETPDSSFIIAATKYFNEKDPDLPLVALTGVQPLFERYLRDFEGSWKVYRKGRDEAVMFASLRGQALGLERVRLAALYPDVYRIVEEHLGGDAVAEYIDCLAYINATSLPRIRGTLANMRALQEKLYLALHRAVPEMIPSRFMIFRESGVVQQSVNVAMILEWLKGNYDSRSQQYQGMVYLHYRSTLYRFSEMVYRVTSDGIHAIDENVAVKPTRYTVQSVMFALMDLILWFRGVVEERRERPDTLVQTQ